MRIRALFRRPLRGTRLPASLAALAVIGQILVGAALPPQLVAVVADVLGGGVPICHSDPSGNQAPTPDRPTHDNDCALCPICALIGHTAVLLPAGPPDLAVSVAAITPAVSRPPATGPPAPIRSLAQPRAPPVPA
jgi:hypothetical protein